MSPAIRRVLAATIISGALAIAWRTVDTAAISGALARARLSYVAIAVILAGVARTWIRVERTRAQLGERIPARALLELHLAGYAVGMLPGPSEEVFCCGRMARSYRLSPRELVRFQVVDKTLAAVSVVVTACLLLPPVLAVVLTLAAVAIAAAVSRTTCALLLWLLGSNVLVITTIAACCLAAGQSPAIALETFLAMSLTGVVTVVPGQVGTLESSFAVVAAHHGGSPAVAIAAAVIYRIAYAPTIIAGVPLLWRTCEPATSR
jgi:uncharacterized membrane protein YbhN (UPF0104 family)